MLEFLRFDTDENRRSLLARARKVVLLALQQYELEWDRIQFIQLSDTVTYKIEGSTGESYLLRIHSDRLSKEEIRSELIFLQALNKSADLTGPEGVASCDGSYVLEIPTEKGYRRPYVTMMRWVEGEHASGDLTDSHVYKMGAMIGRLHEASISFVPTADFVRPVWGADHFERKMMKLESYYGSFLSAEGWACYQAAAEKVVSALAAMQRNGGNYGFIHGDLHSGNMVFKDDSPYPIDFGMCGYGYYLNDIAAAMLELRPPQRQLFIQGYESVRRLEPDYVRHLECFFIMVMIENYGHHCSDPRETSGLIAEQPYAQAYIRTFLSDTRFLFEVIEPVDIV
ncbi:phosphotransferase enzyme family protein [Paenibacillus sp. 481]|uniref:phosphotransferase enzyme family protein n=1 Tax=Paenibacillus sp. 481 TaxID=2835869 RepID=UPI001E2F0DF2|nr:phosphotransferase [Paenibacillus sp. 481]UHA75457.1 phosphotransferase [Paenibacillus sp. 481]